MNPILTTSQPGTDGAAIVLDTNVLLDWLVFDDPHAAPWVTAMLAGRIRWLATEPMREELERVLGYEPISARLMDRHAVDQAWTNYASLLTTAAPAPIVCADPDDQKFIDLAIAQRAKWLLTKDRELLRLATRALTWGVRVLPPARWSETDPPSPSQQVPQ
jgi:uncharacterized protein